MDIKQLEKASRLMDKLKTIDADIIEMEKIAHLLASGQSKQSMVLAVTDTSPETEPKKEVLDSDGSLNTGNQSKGFLGSLFGVSFTIDHSISSNNTNDKRTKKLDVQLSDTTALQVLGVLMEQKLKARIEIIEKLKKLGLEFQN